MHDTWIMKLRSIGTMMTHMVRRYVKKKTKDSTGDTTLAASIGEVLRITEIIFAYL